MVTSLDPLHDRNTSQSHFLREGLMYDVGAAELAGIGVAKLAAQGTSSLMI